MAQTSVKNSGAVSQTEPAETDKTLAGAMNMANPFLRAFLVGAIRFVAVGLIVAAALLGVAGSGFQSLRSRGVIAVATVTGWFAAISLILALAPRSLENLETPALARSPLALDNVFAAAGCHRNSLLGPVFRQSQSRASRPVARAKRCEANRGARTQGKMRKRC